MKKIQKSVDSQVISSIYGHKRGWVFTPGHFKALGSRDAIASALKRHKQTGLIRQLARGGQLFFAEVQNKLLYAVTRHTAAELVIERADPDAPPTWRSPPGAA